MTVHPLNEMTTRSADARLIGTLFRKLAQFREDYDERYLHELFAMLRRRMPEQQADKVMSDALALDNEIRFRLPDGLLLEEDDPDFPCARAQALTRLISHAGAGDHGLAAAAAEELGIENHRILRKYASVLASSLAQGGIEIGWDAGPETMPMTARGTPDVDFRL
jgi:hypothetical protein